MFSQIDGATTTVEKKIDYLRKACLGYAISKNTIPIKIGTLFLAPSRVSRKLSVKIEIFSLKYVLFYVSKLNVLRGTRVENIF